MEVELHYGKKTKVLDMVIELAYILDTRMEEKRMSHITIGLNVSRGGYASYVEVEAGVKTIWENYSFVYKYADRELVKLFVDVQ